MRADSYGVVTVCPLPSHRDVYQLVDSRVWDSEVVSSSLAIATNKSNNNNFGVRVLLVEKFMCFQRFESV